MFYFNLYFLLFYLIITTFAKQQNIIYWHPIVSIQLFNPQRIDEEDFTTCFLGFGGSCCHRL